MPINYYVVASLVLSFVIIFAQARKIDELRRTIKAVRRHDSIIDKTTLGLIDLRTRHIFDLLEKSGKLPLLVKGDGPLDADALFQSVTGIDRRPIPTDWRDYDALLDDMRTFARENPKHLFICADDTGVNRDPPRVPRMGFTAYLDGADNGQSKTWTITLMNLRHCIEGPMSDAMGMTGDERRVMLDKIVEEARATLGQISTS